MPSVNSIARKRKSRLKASYQRFHLKVCTRIGWAQQMVSRSTCRASEAVKPYERTLSSRRRTTSAKLPMKGTSSLSTDRWIFPNHPSAFFTFSSTTIKLRKKFRFWGFPNRHEGDLSRLGFQCFTCWVAVCECVGEFRGRGLGRFGVARFPG